MPFLDPAAAARLKTMREDQGLSPEALAQEIGHMARAAGWTKGTVDAYTIRRIERRKLVPSIRVAFVISHYFGMRPHELWAPEQRIEVAA